MVILLARELSSELRVELDSIVPGAQVVSEADLAVDPSLVGRVEVCYAHLPSGLWRGAASVSEHLFAMLLSLVRNLPLARELQRRRRWDRAACATGLSILEGKTLSVAGLGEIGSRCARIGRAFGMRVIGIRREADPHPEVDEVVGPHCAGQHEDYERRAARVFLDNLRRYASGAPLEHVVDKEAGY